MSQSNANYNLRMWLEIHIKTLKMYALIGYFVMQIVHLWALTSLEIYDVIILYALMPTEWAHLVNINNAMVVTIIACMWYIN